MKAEPKTDHLTDDQLRAMAREYQKIADVKQRDAANYQKLADAFRKAWRKRKKDGKASKGKAET